jgi:glucuronate isomerase
MEAYNMSFMDNNFLLQSKTAIKLYHDYAAKMPIYDYHCHLEAEDIAKDRRFDNITEIWLGGDHYKWRFMRSFGIDEKFITGDAPAFEKFEKWAEALEHAIGNPLYHWSYMELKEYFGITEPLGKKNAKKIFDQCNEIIRGKDFSAQQLIIKSNVRALCTTDDPISDLQYHKELKAKGFQTAVCPTFRPDAIFPIGKKGWKEYVEKLSKLTGVAIKGFDDIVAALHKRVEYFASAGCVLSDHGMEPPTFVECDKATLDTAVAKALGGGEVDENTLYGYKTAIMQALGAKYAEMGWAMQLHIGAMRDNNARMLAKIGTNTGFDSIADYEVARPISRFMDSLDKIDKLPKTILYCLNPKDNAVLATMAGNFQGSSAAGKIQFGSGWWFLDNKDGMEAQIKALGNLGALSSFVGMLTDSRSFLSYTRHEYFRRILCNVIGKWVDEGEVVDNMELLGKIVQDISFNNCAKYLGNV